MQIILNLGIETGFKPIGEWNELLLMVILMVVVKTLT